MRTPRPAAVAATFSLAALLAASDLPSGSGEASAHTRSPSASSPELAALRSCESGGDYGADTGNGYYGAYQFAASTWQSLGYAGLPSNAAPAVQDEAALRLASTKGWSQWPSCSRSLGLSGTSAPPPTRVATAVVVPAAPVAEPAPAPVSGRKVGRELLRWARSAPANG
jgi:resuscitation-promoting factor RpfA